jgi:hypothetical protein
MIYDGKGNVRLTKSELNKLRKYNAQQGHVLPAIKTNEDLLQATISGLPPEIINDMLEFFETGSSPLTRKGLEEKAGDNRNSTHSSAE